MHLITLWRFCPLEARPGHEAIGVGFVTDEGLARTIDDVLDDLEQRMGGPRPGGRLPDGRIWWVEPAVWEWMREAIFDFDHRACFGDLGDPPSGVPHYPAR